MNGGSGRCGSVMIAGILLIGAGRSGRRLVNLLGRRGRCGWLIREPLHIAEGENRDNGNNVGRSFPGSRLLSSAIGRRHYGRRVVC